MNTVCNKISIYSISTSTCRCSFALP